MEPNSTGIATWQWVVSIIVIIALIVLSIYFFTGDSARTTITPQENSPSLNTSGINRLVVTDQYPGKIVFITTVQLAQPGFINITKDIAGAPGTVIGTQAFDKGINTGKITLNETTVDGQTYHALLYYTDAKETILIDKTFKASVDLPEDKG